MSELLREALEGPVGKRIRDDLLSLIHRLDGETLTMIRNGNKPYGDLRYTAGVTDGVRLALNQIMELGKPK